MNSDVPLRLCRIHSVLQLLSICCQSKSIKECVENASFTNSELTKVPPHSLSSAVSASSRRIATIHGNSSSWMTECLVEYQYMEKNLPLYCFHQRFCDHQGSHHTCTPGRNPERKQGKARPQLLQCLVTSSFCHNLPNSELLH